MPLPPPKASAWEPALRWVGTPEITSISYDLWQLRVTVRFDGEARPLYVVFNNGGRGFRVLDEGDLCEFWHPDVRPAGWIWRIESGGWLDLERSRPHFISGVGNFCSEYLIIGENDCVSVLTACEPSLQLPHT